jgi:hypothetical protein
MKAGQRKLHAGLSHWRESHDRQKKTVQRLVSATFAGVNASVGAERGI